MSFILMIFLCLQTVIAEDKEFQIEKEIEQDLSRSNFHTVDAIKFSPPPVKEKEIVKKNPKRKTYFEEQYVAILLEDSTLFEMKSDKTVKTLKPITVHAKQDKFDENKSYIYTQKGELKYWTETNNLQDISREVELLPTPQNHREYPPRTTLYTTDYRIPLSSTTGVSFEQTSPAFFKQFGEEYGNSGTSFRITNYQMYRFHTPVEAGLFLSYEDGHTSNQNPLSWKYVGYGPVFRYFFKQDSEWRFSLRAQIEKSLTHQLSLEGQNYRAESSGFEIGLEAFNKIFFGDLFYGVSVRREFLSLTRLPEGDTHFQRETSPSSNTSFAITIGHYMRYE